MSVAFDHHRAGTPEQEWADDPLLHRLPAWYAPGAGEHLLVVAAHPDDETLGAGGLIASAANRGATVDVVVATDGEASHPASPTHTPTRLSHVRRAEVRAAVHELASTAVVSMLGLPDGQVSLRTTALTDAIRARLQTRTLLITPWARDQHPDHEACAQAGAAAVTSQRHWQYPIWLWHWGTPGGNDLPLSGAGAVHLEPAVSAAKRRALGRHRSQHQPLSPAPGDEAILPPRILAHFHRDFETFLIEPAT